LRMVDRSSVLSIVSSPGFLSCSELMSLLQLRGWKGSLQFNYYESRAVQNMGQCYCLVSDARQVPPRQRFVQSAFAPRRSRLLAL
jgi:hypothetical protein